MKRNGFNHNIITVPLFIVSFVWVVKKVITLSLLWFALLFIVYLILLIYVYGGILYVVDFFNQRKKDKITENISQFFNECSPKSDYFSIRKRAYETFGGIKFNISNEKDKESDVSDYYIEKELTDFIKRNKESVKNIILSLLNKKGVIDQTDISNICQKYGDYCIGSKSFKPFVISTLYENANKKSLFSGETVYFNASGGTHFKINNEISEDDL